MSTELEPLYVLLCNCGDVGLLRGIVVTARFFVNILMGSGSGALEMNCITNREAENSLHKQADEAPAEGFMGRGQNLLSDPNDAVAVAAADSGELSHSHTLQLEAKAQPDAVCVFSTGLLFIFIKLLASMYIEMCSVSCVAEIDCIVVWLQKRARLQKELTFQDLYQNQNMFDDDDDEDSDWEPFQFQNCVEFTKWFCKNCTMVNVGNVVYCEVCLRFTFLLYANYFCLYRKFHSFMDSNQS